jgi:ABC-type transport system substrate-binding protein
MNGRGEVADGPIWKYHWAFSTAQRTYQFNPDAASLRLDAAGLPRPSSGTGGRMPSRFHFRCLLFADDPRFERIALVLQKQLYDIGVDMEIVPLRLEEMVATVRAGRYDAFMLEVISGRSIGRTYRIWRSSPGQGVLDSAYTAADAALERVRHALTESEIRSAVHEVQRVMYEDPPALFLAWPTTSRAVSADIAVPHEPNLDIFGRLTRFERADDPARPRAERSEQRPASARATVVRRSFSEGGRASGSAIQR